MNALSLEAKNGQSRFANCWDDKVVPNPDEAKLVASDLTLTKLSARQLTVLKLLAQGYAFNEITESLGVSLETIKTHVRRIYKKLNVNSRAKAVAIYMQTSDSAGMTMCLSAQPVTKLSVRQLTVLKLLTQGYAFNEIAESLGVSLETVKTHVGRIYSKLNVNSRAKAVAAWRQISIEEPRLTTSRANMNPEDFVPRLAQSRLGCAP